MPTCSRAYQPCAPQDSPCGPITIPCSQKFNLAQCVAGLSFPLADCADDCAPQAPFTDAVAWIRRRGQQKWLLKYPAFDSYNGLIFFRWDDKLLALPDGRYEVQIREGTAGLVCGSVEVTVSAQCRIKVGGVVGVLKHRQTAITATPTAGIFPVFSQFYGLNTTLCADLAVGAPVLPLCAPDLAALCALVTCRPVELTIDDGVNVEVVSFSGCVGGAAQISRGKNGTMPRKFPAGSSVIFAWTPANVVSASTPCP